MKKGQNERIIEMGHVSRAKRAKLNYVGAGKRRVGPWPVDQA